MRDAGPPHGAAAASHASHTRHHVPRRPSRPESDRRGHRGHEVRSPEPGPCSAAPRFLLPDAAEHIAGQTVSSGQEPDLRAAHTSSQLLGVQEDQLRFQCPKTGFHHQCLSLRGDGRKEEELDTASP